MTPPNPKPARKPKPPAPNPIEAAIRSWFSSNAPALAPAPSRPGPGPALEDLLAQAPRRWTVYEPLVLLPAGSFTSDAWRQVLHSATGQETSAALWSGILAEISRRTGVKKEVPLTHLAVNEGIPAHLHPDVHEAAQQQEENILRSPGGLRMLHGDFGPATVSTSEVSEADFERTLWVSTRQNGIFQTWAPRWTMFSRGNVKEKARLLGFHSPSSSSSSSTSCDDDTAAPPRNTGHPSPLSSLRDKYAVDLYAGIGYFVFSYARLGLRVLCWELNPWSVEGLRRGARGNEWTVRVVRGHEALRLPMAEVLAGGEQIVVFLEDNAHAARRIRELRRGQGVDVLHVNCGLLPTSEASWRDACGIVGDGDGAWLHLHENVGAPDIEKRRGEIEQWFSNLLHENGDDRAARVEHVELVKTFAPGVWHCVFDLYITRSSSIT
ncbi:S-adenosyl-L-methionine-dependent methyltransferase [Whalleya microplaca]|nr:S-adenosyl-L-methionine-dependent methyltransferase [Whalleya microplaca]